MSVLPRSHVLAALVFAAAPAGAQVTPYGSGINPPGSLAVLSGFPEIGSTLVLGIQDTANPAAGPSLAVLSLATAPAPGFPSGVVLPGLGLYAPGAPGELLLNSLPPDPLLTLGPVFWAGGANPPAAFALTVPVLASLQGVSVYAQGALVSLTQGNSIGLTNGLQLSIKVIEPDSAKFAWIPPGTFTMGSDVPEWGPYFGEAFHKPAHQVTITKPYWIGRYEVTQQEFEELMGWDPSTFNGAQRPVDSVTKHEAIAYCDALNAQQSARGKVPPGYEYRLPTEAEWEYACRAGTTTEFHYGAGLFCQQARFFSSEHSTPPAQCSTGNTAAVGSFAPNAWDIYDMHGNVMEWCLDGFTLYSSTAKTDPYVAGGGGTSILRGGSFSSYSNHCRSASRRPQQSYLDYIDHGFRVVLGPVLGP